MVKSQHAIEITDQMAETAEIAARRYNVSSALHQDDQLLGYLVNQAQMQPMAAVDAYFQGGHSDAAQVAEIARRSGTWGDGKRVLEFASGYGRVTRHIKNLLPENHVVASDIHEEACRFIRERIGVGAEVSTTLPETLQLSTTFDLIFVLSLFSHLPHRTFGRWLVRLYDALAPGGILLITTHGDFAMRKFPEFFRQNFDSELGFGYRPESDQQDLDCGDYGTAVVSVEYVARQLTTHVPEASILSFHSGTWFGLQDQWLIQKPAGAHDNSAGES
ncbi:MAG: class I SAM-dependent methyltransferase [Rhodoblastus sp.]